MTSCQGPLKLGELQGHPFQLLQCSVSKSAELPAQESNGISLGSAVFVVLQAHSVGWKQNTGKIGMALLLRNERSDSSLEIVKSRFQGRNGTNLVTLHSVSPSILIPAL